MKKRGILGKIIIIIVALIVVGAVFGGRKDESSERSGSSGASVDANRTESTDRAENPSAYTKAESGGRVGGNSQSSGISDNKDYGVTDTAKDSGSSGNTSGSKPEKQDSPALQDKNDKAVPQDKTGTRDKNYVSPELKAFLESYEAYMNEYCEFIESYDSTNALQMVKYASMMQKYTDFSKKAAAYEESDLTDAEQILYMETLNRVNVRLLKANQKIN